MNLAWHNGVSQIPPRHFEVTAPAGTTLADRGVLYAVGSRSDAARLATVLSGLKARGVPQAIALVTSAGGGPVDVFDEDHVPNTELLVGPNVESDVERTAHALAAAEKTLLEYRPRLVILAGDSNQTLAFALAASKLGIEIARVGAGLRSGDFSQSEEINRTLGDRLADVLFTDGYAALETLESEGIRPDRVYHVGNTAVDLLRRCEEPARRRASHATVGVRPGGYVLATLHRTENVMDERRIARIADALVALAQRTPVVFPLHPATRVLLEPLGMVERLRAAGAHVTHPLGYIDFLSLQQTAGAILTDSGGVQDEASALGVRCYTLRRATERVQTLTHGTNVLLGDDPSEIAHVRVQDRPETPAAIPMWDGRAGDRIAAELSGRFTLELAS
jgi:UDP-N-acetylglucosamine 2-epimerase (non-hydrolysing)